MSPIPALAILAGVHLIATLSPGPAILSTVHVSVSSSRKVTLLHALGLGLAIVTWAVATMIGFNALLSRVSSLLRILQICGGLYLMYIGILSWRHAKDPLKLSNVNAGTRFIGQPSAFKAIRGGYLTNIANPKVMVFFASIFTVILTPAMPGWVRVAAIGIVLFNETGWNSLVGVVLSTVKAQTAYTRSKLVIDRTAGALMTLFGLRLLYQARRATT